MKLLHFFIAALLTACSSQIQSTDSATDPAIGEAVTTTVRSFEYMPSPSLLIFSETRDWRHEEGIAGGNLAIIKAAKKRTMAISRQNIVVYLTTKIWNVLM